MRFIVAALLLLATHAGAAELAGRVVGVADGDTLTILDADKVQHVIRLDGIDAPEKAQPFSNLSKRHLSDLAFGRDAVAECHKVDRYGRSVCRVLVDGLDVCLEQVRAGLAWHFKRYAKEQSEVHRRAYAEAEEAARGARVGLWSVADAVAPWDWRSAASMRSIRQERAADDASR
jgi:endonuclease YncB( thermonuclease family)